MNKIPASIILLNDFLNILDPDDCFVATAVYGNPAAPEVNVLRQYRDNVLNHNALGRAFVSFYYSGAGKKAAEFIRTRLPAAIPPIRYCLDNLVDSYSKHLMEEDKNDGLKLRL